MSLIINDFNNLNDDDKQQLQDFISGISCEWEIDFDKSEYIKASIHDSYVMDLKNKISYLNGMLEAYENILKIKGDFKK